MSTSPPSNLPWSWRPGHWPRGPGRAGGQVQELGPLSDETAAETERLAQTLEGLTQQQELIAQFEASGRPLTQLELATVLP